MPTETKIVVADSLEIVRTGLSRSLADLNANHVVIQAATGDQVLEECRRATVDILVLDLSIKSGSGLDTLRKVIHGWPKINVLVQYMEENQRDALQAIGLGARGIIPREARAVDFSTAVCSLAAGFAVLPHTMVRDLINLCPYKVRAGNSYGLTRREIEVLVTSVRYGSTRVVSEVLSISPRTVEAHRSAVYRKIGFKTQAEMQEFAEQFQQAVPVSIRAHLRRPSPAEQPDPTAPVNHKLNSAGH
jgi:two-component system response regulator NreC